MPTYSYHPAGGQPEALVRLLLNDVAEPWVFDDDEITLFLTMEGGNPKRAAAQAIDTNADDQALASKVLKTQDLSTDGAKLADSLRARARSLREQADRADDDADAGYFEVLDVTGPPYGPEMTNTPWGW